MSDAAVLVEDAANATPDVPVPPPPVTSRSDPSGFLGDLDQLARFVDKLRSSGVKTFEHPCGLRLSFEPSAVLPKSNNGW